MDLAESILNELVTLQKKNEELLRIVSKLEHESDIIIRQFEDKISDLHKNLKKAHDQSLKSEKKYEILFREKEREQESFEKDKKELEEDFSCRIHELETTIDQNTSVIQKKDDKIQTLTDQIQDLKRSAALHMEDYSSRIEELTNQQKYENTSYTTKIEGLHQEYQATISQIQEEITRKEKELRALASDLKNRIAVEKKVKKEREQEKTEYDARISEYQNLLDKTRDDYVKLQSSSNEEISKSTKKIQDLIIDLKDLEKEKNDIEFELTKKLKFFEEEIANLQERSIIDLKSIEELTDENKKLVKQSEKLHADIALKEQEVEQEIQDLSLTISALKSEIEEASSKFESELSLKDQELMMKNALLSELNNDLKDLEEKHLADEKAYIKSVQSFTDKIGDLKNQLDVRETSYKEEISRLSGQIEETSHDLEDMIHLKTQREQEFKDEIAHLHGEFVRRKEEWKAELESVAREIVEKDRHITLISGNNEALRAELERVRTRFLMLEKTIREDKEEPVHALYRQIQDLSTKLAEKESEKSVLSSRIIRLDTENTRLAQLLAVVGSSADSDTDGEVMKKGVNTDSPALVRSEISTYLANLDDPLHAMEAAVLILRSGPQVTDILIPLLYQGSQNRRAWIAALLYELNDPRTTKPLSDLLETSETGLRELIWDIRLRFREWKRAESSSSAVL